MGRPGGWLGAGGFHPTMPVVGWEKYIRGERCIFMYGGAISSCVFRDRAMHSSKVKARVTGMFISFLLPSVFRKGAINSRLSLAVALVLGVWKIAVFPPAVDGTKHTKSRAIIRAKFVRRWKASFDDRSVKSVVRFPPLDEPAL